MSSEPPTSADPKPDHPTEAPHPQDGRTVPPAAAAHTDTVDPSATVAPTHPTVPAADAATRWPTLPGYTILGELGRGGMGVVYKAVQVSLKRTVAVKMIRSAEYAGEEEVARFLIEAEAAASLGHPNIVQVYECGRQGQLPYMVLEYVEGGSLGQRLAAGPVPPREAARLVEQVAGGVQFAHDHRIIHRDLKPDNILLTTDGTPKVTDFGLARHIDADSRTRTGAVLGTPSYMAPEQAAGRTHEVGPAADVYAFGAILYHALTGRPPFQAATTHETLLRVIQGDPVPPRKLNATVARDLETICLKCLEKDPRRRYGSAAALADDLRRFLAGEQIHARPAGVVERGWKWVRRRPKLGWLLAAAALVTACLVFVFSRSDSPNSRAVQQACPRVPWDPPDVELVPGPAPKSDLSGFEVVERSVLWDLRGWKPVPADLAKTERIEPAFVTIVLRLRKRPGAANTDALIDQSRTSGLGVYSRCDNHPYRLRKYQTTETMPEDNRGRTKRVMTTWEMVVDLSQVGNGGEEFEVVIHTLHWNGFQDQERGSPTDWLASRYDFPAGKGDLTVLLPPSKHMVSWGFSDFAAETHQPLPSHQAPGTRVNPDKGFIYWEIPQPSQHWVYRVDWSWRDR